MQQYWFIDNSIGFINKPLLLHLVGFLLIIVTNDARSNKY